jgi:hypothetical protein
MSPAPALTLVELEAHLADLRRRGVDDNAPVWVAVASGRERSTAVSGVGVFSPGYGTPRRVALTT